jgi:uncharacterized protein (TIGR03083 family)
MATPAAPRHEAEAFFTALESVPPNAVTACRGWTTHEIVAHLASGAEALANQFDAHFAGQPIPEFGSWEQREPPLRAMPDSALRRRLEQAERRMSAGFDELLKTGSDTVIEQVGFSFPIGELVLHMRQEFAIHRWDLVGDDANSFTLLTQPELLGHCVRMLADPLLAIGLQRDPSPGASLNVRLRCAGEPDLVVDVDKGAGTLALADPADTADVIESDPAARYLLLWGRRPSDARRIRSSLRIDALARLQAIFAGY